METQKIFIYNSGNIKEYNPSKISSGADDAGKIPALSDNGKLDSSLLPTILSRDEIIAIVMALL